MTARSGNPSPIDTSVVVPVYRSEACLAELVSRLTSVLEANSQSFEILLVDDCSPDNSWEEIERLAKAYPQVHGIRMLMNVGQARATLCGIGRAHGEIVITMDDDLQHPPEEIPKLLEALEKEPALEGVFGVFDHKRHAGYRNLGSLAIRRLNAMAFGLPKGFRFSSFRAMRGPVARALVQFKTQTPSISSLMFTVTRRVGNVTVEHADRYAGESNYTLVRQIRFALDTACNVSTLPLQVVSVMGFLTCGVSIILALVIAFRRLFGAVSVSGWTTLVVLNCLFAGLTFLVLGMLGEYLVRVLREVRSYPDFIIRDEVGGRRAEIGRRRSEGGSRREGEVEG